MKTDRTRLWILLASWLLLAVGCDRAPTEFEGQIDEETDQPSIRIVSLAPALTKIIVDMGWSEAIVGTANNDAAAPPGLPVVGTYTDVNSEMLLHLRPTHVLMMIGKEGVPEVVKQMADAGRFDLVTYPTPTSVAGVMQILFDPADLMPGGASITDARSLGAVFGGINAALALSNDLSIKIAQLNDATPNTDRPRVLMLIDTNPMMASGRGTVLDDMLEYAGGRNAASAMNVSAPVFDREKLIEAQPDVILLLLPGAPELLGIDEDPRLAELRGLPIKAVESGRIALINDPLAQLPSTSLPQIGIQMAKLIHPELVEQIDQATPAPAESDADQDTPEPDLPPDEGIAGD